MAEQANLETTLESLGSDLVWLQLEYRGTGYQSGYAPEWYGSKDVCSGGW